LISANLKIVDHVSGESVLPPNRGARHELRLVDREAHPVVKRNCGESKKGEIMPTINSAGQRFWKRCLQDALFESDPQALCKKMKVADEAIEMRRLELNAIANPDSNELAQRTQGLRTLRALGFLKESNGDLEHR
jgi:hypothetical protein